MSVLSAQRLTFRLLVVEEGGGLEPLSVTLPWFSRPVAIHLAAPSIKGCQTGLEPANYLFHKQAPRPLWLLTP